MARQRKTMVDDENITVSDEGISDSQKDAMERYIGEHDTIEENDTSDSTISEIHSEPESSKPKPSKRMVSPVNNFERNTPIRDMELTKEQRDMIVDSELRKILKSKDESELQGGTIPCFLRYPLDNDGFMTVQTFIRADHRLVQSAWDYYKVNSDKPTVRDFINKLWEILGTSEQFRRIVPLDLN